MTNQLIPVFNGTISKEATLLCNARDLHTFLNVGRDFSNWIRERILEYGFTANLDYIIFSPDSAKTVGRKKKDYHLTLDTAKELAMVERNEKGRQVRRYFIECEKKLHQQNDLPALNSQGLPKGVYHCNSRRNPYSSQVCVNGKNIYVGCFPTIAEAVEAQKHYLENGGVKRIQPGLSATEQDLFIGNLHAILHNFRRIDEIWRSKLRPALDLMDSKLVYLLHDRFNDSMCVLPTIEDRIGRYTPPTLPR